MDRKKISWPYKAISFLLLVCLLLDSISGPLVYPYFDMDDDAYGWIMEIYEERPNSLDAVFIGSSNTTRFWMPLVAWREYGIASCNYAMNSQRIESYRYLIEEARKTQPDAVYVLSINRSVLELPYEVVHYQTVLMHHSLTRLRLIRAYAKYNVTVRMKLAELLFPLILYHFRWDELSSWDFSRTIFAKGATRLSRFLTRITDINDNVNDDTVRGEPDMQEEEVFLDLLDYLDRNRVRVLFLGTPQYDYPEEQASLNTLLDLIEARGYPVLRAKEKVNEIGFDFSQDYYNVGHTNIHGAAKYTHFVANYLLENYNITDKRDNPEYADFDAAYEEYAPYVNSSILDFEQEGLSRAFDLQAPELMSVERENQTFTITWREIPNADGYRIYRKSVPASAGNRALGVWEAVADLSSGEARYSERVTEEDATYTYTVVPYCFDSGGGIQYGNFCYSGISTNNQASSQLESQKAEAEDLED